MTALALRTVSDRNAGAPFVARPVADRVAAHARANECARMLDLGELELIRESMCSTFRSGDVVLRGTEAHKSPSSVCRTHKRKTAALGASDMGQASDALQRQRGGDCELPDLRLT